MMICKNPKCKNKLGRYATGSLCRSCKAPKTTAATKARKAEQLKRQRELAKRKCSDCNKPLSARATSDLCLKCRQTIFNAAKRAQKVCATEACENLIRIESTYCPECHRSRRPSLNFERRPEPPSPGPQ